MKTPVYDFEIAEVRTFKEKFIHKNKFTSTILHATGFTDRSLERLSERLRNYVVTTGYRLAGKDMEYGAYEVSYAIYRVDKANFYKMDEEPSFELSNSSISRMSKIDSVTA